MKHTKPTVAYRARDLEFANLRITAGLINVMVVVVVDVPDANQAVPISSIDRDVP